VQFNAGEGNGAECPKGSVYGKAKAISPLLDEPLAGPVFLRSSDHELPDLVAALHSAKVDIDLVGRIDSTKQGGIRSTFEGVPDAPVSKFTLEMQGGKKGLIVNSTNICKQKHRAKAASKGQNGKLREFNPVVKAKCGGKKKPCRLQGRQRRPWRNATYVQLSLPEVVDSICQSVVHAAVFAAPPSPVVAVRS
jgi:hypothetical protein